MKWRIFRLLLSLPPSFLWSIIPLHSVGSDDIFPDKWLDLFGITQSAATSRVIFTEHLAVYPDIIPDGSTSRRNFSVSPILPPFHVRTGPINGPPLLISLVMSMELQYMCPSRGRADRES